MFLQWDLDPFQVAPCVKSTLAKIPDDNTKRLSYTQKLL